MNVDTLLGGITKPHNHNQIERVLSGFQPIHLEEMNNVALLNRIDTKYLIPLSELYAVLEHARPYYRVLDINRIRLNRYHTVYFDTPDFELYHQHHNSHSSRYKVRARQYVDTNVAFFEVKHKTNQDRTIKSRLPLNHSSAHHNGMIEGFIDDHVPVDSNALEPKLWNDYLRLTLVGVNRPERVTIDLNLSFSWEGAYVDLPGVAIAEVKQSHFSQDSDFIQQIRGLGIRDTSFSKYCAGVYLLYEGVKTNNFKLRMRQVDKIMQQEVANGHLY